MRHFPDALSRLGHPCIELRCDSDLGVRNINAFELSWIETLDRCLRTNESNDITGANVPEDERCGNKLCPTRMRHCKATL